MQDRPLREDEYPDENEAPPRQVRELDPISAGVGSGAYVYRHTERECVERYAGGVGRFPEVFDRFYFDAPGGPVLVDVLMGDRENHDLEAQRKHVAFKRAWCEEHERRYLALTEDEAADANAVRALLAPGGEETAAERETRERPSQSRPQPSRSSSPRRKRGAVQRPKAAA